MKKSLVWATCGSVLFGLVLGWQWLFAHQLRLAKAQVHAQLTGIAQLKVERIAAWRRERLADAEMLLVNQPIMSEALRFLAGEASAQGWSELKDYLGALLRRYKYQGYLLVEVDGGVRYTSVGPEAGGLAAEGRAALTTAWRTHRAILSELHTGAEYPKPHMAAVVPLFRGDSPAGAVLLLIDARESLYPILQSWPLSSASAESLLIRREDEHALFLTDLRHRENAALTLRIPLIHDEEPAVRTILGKTADVIEGLDYRGVRVLWFGLPVPDSPWFLVAKIDTQEVFAGARREMLLLAGGLIASLLLASLTALIWLRRQRSQEQAVLQLKAEKLETLKRFQNLFEQSMDGILLLSSESHCFLDANPAALRMLGYSRDELLRLRLPDILAEEKQPRLFRDTRIALDVPHSQEWLHKRKDGSTFVGEVNMKALDPNRNFAIVRDITERKHAEESLRLSEERYRLLAENANDVIWTMDLQGRFTYVSPAIARMYGYLPEELLQLPLNRLLTPESCLVATRELDRVLQAIHSGAGDMDFRGELETIRKDGSVSWSEVYTTVIPNDKGEVVSLIGVSRDINDRKRHEQELRRARDAANAASVAKTQFLAHMSHEIRTPMNAVLGLAQLLAREPLTPGQAAMVRHICEAGDTLLHIINDILDFSKIEAGQLRIDPRPFTVSAVLGHMESLFRMAAEAKGLALSIHGTPEHLGTLLGDSLRLEQVLINLLGNAIKFTQAGCIGLSVTPVVTDSTTARLRFEVRDTGIGIPPEVLAQLFQPFSQGDASITRRFGGTGLGLAISRRLIDLMAGKLGATSEVGQGSTFWFEIPFKRSKAPEPLEDTRVTEEAQSAAPQLAGLRVLAVDDSHLNLMVVERALKIEGASVSLAADGQQALQILKAQPHGFDIVLMDIQMPVMDGLTATREIRRDSALAKLPIIALTAGALPEEREAALSAGMNDFLAKPLDLKEMNTVLSAYLPQS